MERLPIRKRGKFDDLTLYIAFEKTGEDHVLLIYLLSKLGIAEEQLNEIDIIFDDLDEEFFHFFNDLFKVDLFVTKKAIHLSFLCRSQEQKNGLVRLLREYFDY